ncbi:hypothetical protein Syun_024160 [Stephania yunnanensis]|uniref:Short-chain dehydrogenase TIC 32, chloroplastic-like n=1 Tax=Stephania yunnanensis TaxID=152371 RepID=A0AAP0I3Y7_9MAGN
MKETLRYLAGVAGPSGFGSSSTAEQVTEDCSSSLPSHLTAIVTVSPNSIFFFHMPNNSSKHGRTKRKGFKCMTYDVLYNRATSGIGGETARVLAKRGVRLVIPARDLNKGQEAKERIQKECPNAEIILLEIDLSSFASVKRFCYEFLSLELPLNLLINNAGKFNQNLEYSEDKIEMTFATNYLGHFLLTELLMEKMIETAEQTGIQGRIINVSSVLHSWVKRDEFHFKEMLNPKRYHGTRAYAQSKLANILHAKEIARKLKSKNAKVTINTVHPGIVKTDSLFFLASKLLKSVSQGASTACYVALSPSLVGANGNYFADCNESSCSALANSEYEAHKLWKQSRALLHKQMFRSSS